MDCCMIIFTGILAGKTVWSTVATFWSGLVWFGLVWFGLVWSSLVWSGLVWSGVGLPVWCSCGGVTCDSMAASQTYARIIGMDFSFAWIAGSLPSSIGNLKVMKILNLHNNQIGKTIPSSIGDLTALTYLDWRTNRLISPIPNSSGVLSSETYLGLGENLIFSTIPSSLNMWTNLKTLFLDTNFFDGIILSFAMRQIVSIFKLFQACRFADRVSHYILDICAAERF